MSVYDLKSDSIGSGMKRERDKPFFTIQNAASKTGLCDICDTSNNNTNAA